MKNRVKLTSSFSHFLMGLICLTGMAFAAYFLYRDVVLYLENPKAESVNTLKFKSEDFQPQNLAYLEKAQDLIQNSIATKEKEAQLLRMQQEKERAELLAKQRAEAKRKANTTKKTSAKTAAAKKPVVIPDLVPAPLQEPLLLSPTESQIISDADFILTDSPSLEFEWEAVPRAQKYYFELFDKNNNHIVSKYTTKTIVVLDDELPLLADEGQFSWQVTASATINNKNLSQTSEKQTFSIILDPIAPVVIDKSNLVTEE